MGFIQYIFANKTDFLAYTWQHIYITLIVAVSTITIGVILGIIATREKRIGTLIINIANIGQTVPTFAVFGLVIPFMGIGLKPAIVALFAYAILPIVRNTYAGIKKIDPAVIEAGKGMGMTGPEILFLIQLPLSVAVIMAGIRTSVVVTIGSTALAAFIAAGGLGNLIFRGIAMMDNSILLAGAVPIALLAILADFGLGRLERSLVPRGIRFRNER